MVVLDAKADVVVGEGEAVEAGGVVVVVGPRVEGQRLAQGQRLSFRERTVGRVGEDDLQLAPLALVREAPARLRMGVGIGQVGA